MMLTVLKSIWITIRLFLKSINQPVFFAIHSQTALNLKDIMSAKVVLKNCIELRIMPNKISYSLLNTKSDNQKEIVRFCQPMLSII